MAGQRLQPWALWISAANFNLFEVLSRSSYSGHPRFGNKFIVEQHLERSQLPLGSDERAIDFLKKLYRSHGPISFSLEGEDEDNNIFIRCSRPSKDSVSNSYVTFLIWVTPMEAGVFLLRHRHYFQDQVIGKKPTSEANNGLVTKVHGVDKPSAALSLDEESSQNRSPTQPTISEKLKDSTTNEEFSQVSLKTVKADHEAESFSVPEPSDGPDCVEEDWLILDASEL